MKRIFFILSVVVLAFCSCKKEHSEVPKAVKFANIENADYIAYKSISQLKSDEVPCSLYALTITGDVLESNVIRFVDENGNEISSDFIDVAIASSYEIDNFIWFSGKFNIKTSEGDISMKSFLVNKSTGEMFDTQGFFPSFDREFGVQTDAANNYYFATTANGISYALKKISFAEGSISITECVNEHQFLNRYFGITPGGDCVYSAEYISEPNVVMLANGTKITADRAYSNFFSDGQKFYGVSDETYVCEIIDGVFTSKPVESNSTQTAVSYRQYFTNETFPEDADFAIVGKAFECGPNSYALYSLSDNMNKDGLYILGIINSTVWVANVANSKVYSFSFDDCAETECLYQNNTCKRYILNQTGEFDVPNLSQIYISVVDENLVSFGGFDNSGYVSGILGKDVLKTTHIDIDKIIKL